MLKRQKNSAKFKKDYIAYLAIFLFFMVVCSEITIAIWLPMQMRSTWIGAKAMAEQRMIDIFDHTRRRYHSALNKKIDKNAENEMQIIKGVLDYNARFLREKPDINQEQIKQLHDDYVTFLLQNKIYLHENNKDKAYYCLRKKIDPAATLKRLKSDLSLKK